MPTPSLHRLRRRRAVRRHGARAHDAVRSVRPGGAHALVRHHKTKEVARTKDSGSTFAEGVRRHRPRDGDVPIGDRAMSVRARSGARRASPARPGQREPPLDERSDELSAADVDALSVETAPPSPPRRRRTPPVSRARRRPSGARAPRHPRRRPRTPPRPSPSPSRARTSPAGSGRTSNNSRTTPRSTPPWGSTTRAPRRWPCRR